MIKKRRQAKKRRGSLYLGLMINILIGALLAALVFTAVLFPGVYLVNNFYLSEYNRGERHSTYLDSLQEFVTDNAITLADSDRIAEWVRSNPYVYLLVYKSGNALPVLDFDTPDLTPGARDKLSELSGTGISDDIERDQLIADAQEGGYYRIDLADGSVIVALAEYSEGFYRGALVTIGSTLGIVSFVIILINYVRRIIKRIKRFESDVNIVSEEDMTHEIVSSGRDEITNLTSNVEVMRRKMLDNIKREQEAREANTELITAMSHDIRTPLTVLLGYLDMMKNYQGADETMQSYISAGENTAMRLKQLSDDMFKYALAFSSAEGDVKLEEYNAVTLIEQLVSENLMLMEENGFAFEYSSEGREFHDDDCIVTDAPNLMRIFENIFSNLRKYADKTVPISMHRCVEGDRLTIEFKNKIRKDPHGVESNGIGLKTCVRLASFVADGFEYNTDGEYFTARLSLRLSSSDKE